MTDLAYTPQQLHVLERALGLPNIKRKQWRKTRSLDDCYRNHYVASEGHHSWGHLLELAARGLMTRRDVHTGVPSSIFCVTEAGFDTLRAYGKVPPRQQEFWRERG